MDENGLLYLVKVLEKYNFGNYTFGNIIRCDVRGLCPSVEWGEEIVPPLSIGERKKNWNRFEKIIIKVF